MKRNAAHTAKYRDGYATSATATENPQDTSQCTITEPSAKRKTESTQKRKVKYIMYIMYIMYNFIFCRAFAKRRKERGRKRKERDSHRVLDGQC